MRAVRFAEDCLKRRRRIAGTPHISVGPLGRAVLGGCAFLSSLALGAYSVALAMRLVAGGLPAVVWKAVWVHLLELSAVASIFMLLLAIRFWIGGCRWIDWLLYRIMSKGAVAVFVIVAAILAAVMIALPEIRIPVAVGIAACLVAVPVLRLIRKRRSATTLPTGP